MLISFICIFFFFYFALWIGDASCPGSPPPGELRVGVDRGQPGCEARGGAAARRRPERRGRAGVPRDTAQGLKRRIVAPRVFVFGKKTTLLPWVFFVVFRQESQALYTCLVSVFPQGVAQPPAAPQRENTTVLGGCSSRRRLDYIRRIDVYERHLHG